jgi:cell division protein YceG involved in septum cleavage
VKRVLSWLFILSFIAGGITAWWFWHDMQQQLDSPINIETGTTISYTITPGMNLKIIGEDLVQQGILKHPYYLILSLTGQ